MEVWGGVECTINKVGEQYFDQLEYSGHYHRQEDLELIAGLGIKKIRYPILWEKYSPQTNTAIHWAEIKKKLLFFKGKGIEVIAGLVHHGSGPAYVDITDDSFAYGLAAYAAKVAAKFPWINYYTPVNEPLTTARFCGLYGLWAPHGRDAQTFLSILLNECKATVLAMRAIREINPVAKLVLTEDLGKIHSTPFLSYQADFENQRRWLSIDLLCGKVNETHPLWDYLLSSGVNRIDLQFFLDNPYPPDILGFNYYITSERFIDENLNSYPEHTHGGNGRHHYADVEVVRSDKASLTGPYVLLKEAWERYGLPVAITEVHLHCSREEQLRWFNFIYQAALKLETEGVNIQAVTSWALLGSFGWDKLLTQPRGNYEPGTFDIRSGRPRPSAVAQMLKCIAQNLDYDHPVLCGGGWWEREDRVIYGEIAVKKKTRPHCPPILILGKTGTLGTAFAKICEQRDLHYEILDRNELDVLDVQQIKEVIREKKPWAIINTTGFVRVDDAEAEREACFLTNAQACKNLAVLCEIYHIKLLTFSTDLVFDGDTDKPYDEDARINPLNVYGKSKAAAEKLVQYHNPDALIVRSSFFFGPWDKYNFLHAVATHLDNEKTFAAPGDIKVSPTYVPDLVNVSLDLLIDNERGIWHLANSGETSPANFAASVAKYKGARLSLIVNEPFQNAGFIALRPKYSVLKSKRGNLLPTLEDALERYFREVG